MFIRLLALLAITAVGISAVFVGRHEGKINGGSGRLAGLQLLGANKCTWGPGYWCKNISTSHECKAIDHCVTKQWNNLELHKDNSSICQTCIETLASVEKAINSTFADNVVEDTIYLICENLRLKTLVEKCSELLTPFASEIHKAIVNHLEPQVTCHLIHFCNDDQGGIEKVLQAKMMAAVQPLGPVIIGNEGAVYGDTAPKVAPLTCNDGEVYWCQNMKTAKECHAVDHCNEVVWKHQKNSPTPEISDINDSTASPATVNFVLDYSKVALESTQCHSGQNYWCTNITTATSCHAVGHCIQTVWSHMKVAKDQDSVCQICKDMVKQARDQLQSNLTQEELKEVFEGSCALVPVKVIREGCDQLVDEFVPELIEVLSSQMNPDVVCSVAGLCNNVQIDRLLQAPMTTTPSSHNSDCPNCEKLALKLEDNFKHASKEEFVQGLHIICSEFSALSDVCIKIVNARSAEWYSNVAMYFDKGMFTDEHFPFSILNMCRTNNLCVNTDKPLLASSGDHSKTSTGGISVELQHHSETGVVAHSKTGDDLPCDLCNQLIHHLKDILIANTTKTEFKQVLEGICEQTGNFKAECTEYVKKYYGAIYTFLTDELDAKFICSQVGLCPKPHTVVFNNLDILAPIVPISIEPVHDEESHKLPSPIAPEVLLNTSNMPACTLCEYILHYVQVRVSNEKNEHQILVAMTEACNQMPGDFAKECNKFVDEYGKAFIALFVQQIDPSQVCPKLKVCSAKPTALAFGEPEGKGLCPLCLLAVQAIEEELQSNRSEENIKHTLDKICTTLPKSLSADCDKFISKYYDELIDMIVAETTPQEICVYIKLCLPPKRSDAEHSIVQPAKQHVEQSTPGKDSQACILCEFIMTNLDHIIKEKKTEDEIKHAVHSVCRVMPKSIKQECYDFVNQYADLIIQLLAQSLEPKQVCQALALCDPTSELKLDVQECALCKNMMSHLDDADVVDNQELDALNRLCYHVPKSLFKNCNKFIAKYGNKILPIMGSSPSYLICSKINVCDKEDSLNFVSDTFELKQTLSEHEETPMKKSKCKSFYGFSICETQAMIAFIGVLACLSMIILLLVARAFKRNRINRGAVSPYEKLYQPTTVPRDSDEFTASILS